jgi:diguanylate cyclase (GGDEF)-like protein
VSALAGLTLEDNWLDAALAELVTLLANPSDSAFQDASVLMAEVHERKTDILYRIAQDRLQFAEALRSLTTEVQTLSNSLGVFSGRMERVSAEAATCSTPEQAMAILQDAVYETRQVSARVTRMRSAMHDAEHKLMQATEAAQVLRQLHAEEATAAETDPLTGLLNRRGFDRRIGSMPEERSYSMLVLDIDRFKQINDVYGHPIGDIVISAVADMIRENVRSEDLTVRYGGEEFIAWLPDTSLVRARVVAERIRQACERIYIAECPSAKVTVSIGVGLARDSTEATANVLARADQALLSAKTTGRNKVLAQGDIAPVSDSIAAR